MAALILAAGAMLAAMAAAFIAFLALQIWVSTALVMALEKPPLLLRRAALLEARAKQSLWLR